MALHNAWLNFQENNEDAVDLLLGTSRKTAISAELLVHCVKLHPELSIRFEVRLREAHFQSNVERAVVH